MIICQIKFDQMLMQCTEQLTLKFGEASGWKKVRLGQGQDTNKKWNKKIATSRDLSKK